jgi:hypothetical protein
MFSPPQMIRDVTIMRNVDDQLRSTRKAAALLINLVCIGSRLGASRHLAPCQSRNMQHSSVSPPPPRPLGTCHECNGRFGLIRHRFALKQFCSKRCLQKYRIDSERKVGFSHKAIDRLSRWRTLRAFWAQRLASVVGLLLVGSQTLIKPCQLVLFRQPHVRNVAPQSAHDG